MPQREEQVDSSKRADKLPGEFTRHVERLKTEIPCGTGYVEKRKAKTPCGAGTRYVEKLMAKTPVGFGETQFVNAGKKRVAAQPLRLLDKATGNSDLNASQMRLLKENVGQDVHVHKRLAIESVPIAKKKNLIETLCECLGVSRRNAAP